VPSSAVMNLIGNVLALRDFTELVVDLVQSKEKRSPRSRCEDCLLRSGLVQDAYIVVALPQLDDSVVGAVEGLHVLSIAVDEHNESRTRTRLLICMASGYG